jgi:hypothetical protein
MLLFTEDNEATKDLLPVEETSLPSFPSVEKNSPMPTTNPFDPRNPRL